jgi:hypothetical protein
MKLAFAIIAILIVAVTIYADYRWRRWMAARRQDRNRLDRSKLP